MEGGKMRICLYRECENIIPKKKKNNKYCSIYCFSEERKDTQIQAWLSGEWDGTVKTGLANGIREYLIDKAKHACTKCNWSEKNVQTGKVPLEVNHIDGDYINNHPLNIEILCPNCHSLTENYKALNKNGRGWRAEYSQYVLVKEEDRKVPIRTEPSFCTCGSPKSNNASLCSACLFQERKNKADSSYPPTDELIILIEEFGYVQAGKKIGRSDNAIRKHLKRHGFTELPKRQGKPK